MAIPTLLGVLTAIFIVMRVAPGDPAEVILGEYASQEALATLRDKLGLNKPLWLQYVDFLDELAHGNLGVSVINGKPVSALVARALPYSLELAIAGIVLGVIFGLPLGIYTAIHRNTLSDYLGRIVSLFGLSFPTFYLGILLLLIFSVRLEIFPVIGGGELHNIGDNLYHLVLPALTMGLIMMAYVTRMSRSSILNVLNEDYVRTARSKGVVETSVIYKHVLKNALIPIISIVGVYSVVLIGGTIMVELVFSRPGIGRMMIGAMKQRDYITIQSIMIIYAALVIIINLVTDISYGFVDPRIKYE
jgi:ABC-type dipeptide/oligopeptide/nickel transport system permease component